MFKENGAFNHATLTTLTRGLPPNIFSTFQSINGLASIDCASYKSIRQTFNLTLVGSEDSFSFSVAVSEAIPAATTAATAITISASAVTALTVPRVAVSLLHTRQ